jgi:hypothetical protein
MNVVEQTAADVWNVPPAPLHDASHAATQAMPQAGGWQEPQGGAHAPDADAYGGGYASAAPTTMPVQVTPLVGAAAAAAAVAVAGCFFNLWSYETDASPLVDGKLNYVVTNAVPSVIIAAVVMVAGALLGSTGRRIGSGIAGGVGLAIAGFVGFEVVGFSVGLFDTLNLVPPPGTKLTTTYEIGFFVMIAAAALGVITFVLSLQHAGADGRPRLNQGVAAIGAVAALAAFAGPLVPENGGSFGDNFSQDTIPPIVLILRLVLLALVLLTGLWGFFHGRRWGIGLAFGGVSIVAWQVISSLAEISDADVPPAGGNFFSDGPKPHIVTTIGVLGVIAFALVALAAGAKSRSQQ